MPSLTVVSRSPQKLDIRGRDSGIDLFWWLSKRCVVAIALLGWRESCVMEMGPCWIQEAEGSFGVVECHVVVVPEGFFRLKVFISEWHGHKVAISAGQTVETIGATYLGAAYLSTAQWNVSPRHPAGPLHGKSEHSFKAACNARRGGGMLKMRALFNNPACGCLMWGKSPVRRRRGSFAFLLHHILHAPLSTNATLQVSSPSEKSSNAQLSK